VPPPATLDRLLWPESIAVVGASTNTDSISGRPLRFLKQLGYGGRLYPVNPRHDTILGLKVYPGVGALPEPVDLAILAVPAGTVPGVLRECAAAGVRSAVVLSAGFADGMAGDRARERKLLEIARASGLRLLGPNSEGFCNFLAPVPAGFSPTIDPERGLGRLTSGRVAVLTQSGGLGFALCHDGRRRGLGFSYVVSTGNETDLDLLDFLEYVLEDDRAGVVLLFVEGFRRPRRFPELARRAWQLGRPLVVAKVGSSVGGRRAAASHTAHLAGRDAAYDAVFRRWGVARARDQEDAVDLALALDRAPLPAGPRVGIVTFSGGSGAWMADACQEAALEVPLLSPDLQARLRPLLPPYGATANPVDVTAQIIQTAGGVAPVLDLLTSSDEVDAVVLVTTLLAAEPLLREARELRELLRERRKPLIVYSYTQPSEESLALLAELGLPWYPSGRRAARALRALYDHGRFRRRPPAVAGADAAAASTVRLERAPLVEHEAKGLLRRCGLTVPRGRVVDSAEEAAEAARALGRPVAVKVQSAALPHKSDQGLVALALADPEAVRGAGASLLARAAALGAGDAALLVEEMAGPGVEMLLGAVCDADFGPMIVVGMGGVDVEELADTAMAPAPVSLDEARELIQGLRGSALLRPRRGRPGADVEALARALQRLSELAAANDGAFGEIDVNPIVVHPAGQGATVVDALVTAPRPVHSAGD
jgi:acyl-CoA synthetase (NDP forming)